jgi:hypothetical protein
MLRVRNGVSRNGALRRVGRAPRLPWHCAALPVMEGLAPAIYAPAMRAATMPAREIVRWQPLKASGDGLVARQTQRVEAMPFLFLCRNNSGPARRNTFVIRPCVAVPRNCHVPPYKTNVRFADKLVIRGVTIAA